MSGAAPPSRNAAGGRPRFSGMLRTRSSALIACPAPACWSPPSSASSSARARSRRSIRSTSRAPRSGRSASTRRAAGPRAPNPYAQALWLGRGSGAPGRDLRRRLRGPPGRATRRGLRRAGRRRATLPPPYWRDVTPTTELRPWQPGADARSRPQRRALHALSGDAGAGRRRRPPPAAQAAIAPDAGRRRRARRRAGAGRGAGRTINRPARP